MPARMRAVRMYGNARPQSAEALVFRHGDAVFGPDTPSIKRGTGARFRRN